jgi:hypothetical protein
MINKKLLVLFIIAFACSLNFSFAYPKLSEADHKFIDTMLNRYHSISKDLKKEKSELYSKVANDAKVLRNAYLWAYTWDKLKWEILTKESIEYWVEQYNKFKDSKKNSTIETLKEVQSMAEELQRSFQIESEEDFEGYWVTVLPTPLYWLNKKWTIDINRIMWWEWSTWLLLDSSNTIDQLGIVLPVWTPVTLIKKIVNWKFTYYEVRTRDFDVWYGENDAYFLDSRFVKLEEHKPDEVIHIVPDMSSIFKTLLAAVDSQYIWWGSYYQWIPEINELYPTPDDVKLSTWEQQYKILQWTDCSWLLWQATNWYTPRTTRSLLTFWDPVAISWFNVDQIVWIVKPLDLIVWAGHVVIILSDEYAIESIWKKDFEWWVEVVKLDERLKDIFTRRQPVNEWSKSSLPETKKFVIRRWFKW